MAVGRIQAGMNEFPPFLLLKFLCFEVNILYIIFHFYSNEMIFEFSLKMRGTLHISTKLLYF